MHSACNNGVSEYSAPSSLSPPYEFRATPNPTSGTPRANSRLSTQSRVSDRNVSVVDDVFLQRELETEGFFGFGKPKETRRAEVPYFYADNILYAKTFSDSFESSNKRNTLTHQDPHDTMTVVEKLNTLLARDKSIIGRFVERCDTDGVTDDNHVIARSRAVKKFVNEVERFVQGGTARRPVIVTTLSGMDTNGRNYKASMDAIIKFQEYTVDHRPIMIIISDATVADYNTESLVTLTEMKDKNIDMYFIRMRHGGSATSLLSATLNADRVYFIKIISDDVSSSVDATKSSRETDCTKSSRKTDCYEELLQELHHNTIPLHRPPSVFVVGGDLSFTCRRVCAD
jgi:hypothetical protein